MEREKPTFDILGRIEKERAARNWSEYALAENSGLTQSTISTWRRRNLQPNVASIEKICSGFGITLSQFFQEEDSVYLTKEQKKLLDLCGIRMGSETLSKRFLLAARTTFFITAPSRASETLYPITGRMTCAPK